MASPIQRDAIQPILAGRDLVGCAQTGTGKTAAFALPILDRFIRRPRTRRSKTIRALVLAPSRELATQIAESFTRYAEGTGITAGVAFGGVSKLHQVRMLRRGLDVLVACPGRLLDLIGDRAVDLSHVECLVLDEADRMLDMGFVRDVRRISALTPASRQTLLFSATMPKEIRDLSAEILTNPIAVSVDPIASICEPIDQHVHFVEKDGKLPLLLSLLRDEDMTRALVFTRTKRGADKVVKKLALSGVRAVAIHGNKSQPQRERALRRLKEGHARIVVATDLAARGLDIKELSHVVNFDLPVDAESYVHRVGRTGRAGASGVALSICTPEEISQLTAIEALTQRRLQRMNPEPAARPSPPKAHAPARAARGRSAPARPAAARPAPARPAPARPPVQGRRRRMRRRG